MDSRQPVEDEGKQVALEYLPIDPWLEASSDFQQPTGPTYQQSIKPIFHGGMMDPAILYCPNMFTYFPDTAPVYQPVEDLGYGPDISPSRFQQPVLQEASPSDQSATEDYYVESCPVDIDSVNPATAIATDYPPGIAVFQNAEPGASNSRLESSLHVYQLPTSSTRNSRIARCEECLDVNNATSLYKCSCGKVFSFRGNLTRHLKPEKMVRCHYAGCNKAYTRSDNLKKHQRKSHKTSPNHDTSHGEEEIPDNT